MGTLNSTKYGLITRAVSTTQDVLPNDTALAVDLLNGSITLTLNQIPDDSWQTSYKLYVSISAMKGAGETLTINAGSGQKINGQQTLVLDNIDYVAVIRVSSNSTYIAQLNYSQATEISVLDEGVELTPSVSSLNFTGAGVTATNVGNAVTIDVPDTRGGVQAVVSLASKTLPISPVNIRRVSEGTTFNATNSLGFDFLNQYGSLIGTFNTTTGIWTCPVTGYYDFTVLVGLIANGLGNENNITPNAYQPHLVTQTSGVLIVGKTYVIKTILGVDDFTNVGAASNTSNITFVATGTTPTTWASLSVLISPSTEIISSTPYTLEMSQYLGSFAIGCGIPNGAGEIGTIFAQNHSAIYYDNSTININATYTNRLVYANETVICKYLNKTQLIGGGGAGQSFHFTVKRVY